MENQNEKQTPFTKKMSLTLRAEEVTITAVAIYFLTLHNLGLSFWVWIPLFLIPDLSMLGYMLGSSVGAVTYNLFHHRGVAILLAAVGYFTHHEVVTAFGLLLLAHSSFDRMFGYGLKYDDSFNHTSLGWTGKKTPNFTNASEIN